MFSLTFFIVTFQMPPLNSFLYSNSHNDFGLYTPGFRHHILTYIPTDKRDCKLHKGSNGMLFTTGYPVLRVMAQSRN